MKKLFLIILIFTSALNIHAQGMYTERGRFSFSAGTGYIYADEYDALSFYFGTSILGFMDIGGIYTKAISTDLSLNPEGGTAFLDFYAKKDSLYGVVLNLAFGTINYQSSFLAGISLYGKFKIPDESAFTLYPHLSIGYLTTESFALSFGFGSETSLNKYLSIVLTPGINVSEAPQFIIGAELVVK